MAIIGPGCTIAAGSVVEESVLQEGCTLEENVVVRRSIIARGASVGAGTIVAGGAIIGEDARVEGDNILTNHIRIYPGTVDDGRVDQVLGAGGTSLPEIRRRAEPRAASSPIVRLTSSPSS